MALVTTYQNRKVYFYTSRLREIASKNFQLPTPHFICSFFFHNTNWDKNELEKALFRLVKGGCVYFLFHGFHCEEGHNLADEIILKLHSSKETDKNVIMTTWHSKETMKNVIFNTFCTAWPAENYENSFSSYIIFSLGSTKENTYVRNLLNNLKKTIKQASSE